MPKFAEPGESSGALVAVPVRTDAELLASLPPAIRAKLEPHLPKLTQGQRAGIRRMAGKISAQSDADTRRLAFEMIGRISVDLIDRPPQLYPGRIADMERALDGAFSEPQELIRQSALRTLNSFFNSPADVWLPKDLEPVLAICRLIAAPSVAGPETNLASESFGVFLRREGFKPSWLEIVEKTIRALSGKGSFQAYLDAIAYGPSIDTRLLERAHMFVTGVLVQEKDMLCRLYLYNALGRFLRAARPDAAWFDASEQMLRSVPDTMRLYVASAISHLSYRKELSQKWFGEATGLLKEVGSQPESVGNCMLHAMNGLFAQLQTTLEDIQIFRRIFKPILRHASEDTRITALNSFMALMLEPNFDRAVIPWFERMTQRVAKEPKDVQPYLANALKAYTQRSDPALDKLLALEKFYDDPRYAQYPPEERMNLAYGIEVLGGKNALRLTQERGISYFLRYSKEELERQMYQVDQTYRPKHARLEELKQQAQKPVFLVVYNKNDWNGGFYDDQNKFNTLSKDFNVVVYEAGNEDAFYDAVEKTAKIGDITHLLIGGHGSPNGIQLGAGREETAYLDLTDAQKMKGLKKYLQGAIVILEACSTGQDREAIGGVLAKTWEVSQLFAPVEPAAINQDGWRVAGGKVVDMQYSVDKSVFNSKGEPTRVPVEHIRIDVGGFKEEMN